MDDIPHGGGRSFSGHPVLADNGHRADEIADGRLGAGKAVQVNESGVDAMVQLELPVIHIYTYI